MTDTKSPRRSVPRIESIRIKNYRALCDLELKPLAPLTALLGASGSGKSTVFDAPHRRPLPRPKMGVVMTFARKQNPPARRAVPIGDSSKRCPK